MEVLDSIYLIHRLLQTTCLTCLHYERGAKLKQSRALFFYSILIVLISIALLLHGIFDASFYSSGNDDVGGTVDYIQLLGVRVAHFVVILESISRSKTELEFFQKIQEIDHIFEKSLHENLHKNEFRTGIIWRCIGMCLLYLGSQMFVLGALLISDDDFISLPYWAAYFFPLSINGFRYFQIFTAVYMVKIRFDKINDCLGSLKLHYKIKNSGLPKYSGSFVITTEIYETGHRLNRINSTAAAYNKLIILRDVYNRLWELTLLINKCYGISLLINIGNDFVSVTANCYWMFLRFKQAQNSTFLELINVIGSAVWSVPHFFNMFIITAVCHWTVQSANKTAVMVHKIDIDIGNDSHNIFIEQFSLQLLHQKTVFTAFGFFNVDFTLLYTIAGATTTYLIILIQFHMSEQKNASENNTNTTPNG